MTFLGIGVLFVSWVGWPQTNNPTDSDRSFPQTNVSSSSTGGTIQSGSTALPQEAVPFVPHRGEAKGTLIHDVTNGDSGLAGAVKVFIVDLNDGTSAELEHLPGIGAVLAERIVAYRASHGAFRRVEDLILVPGIGEKRFQQLRPFVAVREPIHRVGMGS